MIISQISVPWFIKKYIGAESYLLNTDTRENNRKRRNIVSVLFYVQKGNEHCLHRVRIYNVFNFPSCCFSGILFRFRKNGTVAPSIEIVNVQGAMGKGTLRNVGGEISSANTWARSFPQTNNLCMLKHEFSLRYSFCLNIRGDGVGWQSKRQSKHFFCRIQRNYQQTLGSVTAPAYVILPRSKRHAW